MELPAAGTMNLRGGGAMIGGGTFDAVGGGAAGC